MSKLYSKTNDELAEKIDKVLDEYLPDGWNGNMREQILAAVEELCSEVIGADSEHKLVQKPLHGSCCTCQTCGLPHDECREIEMEYKNDLRAEQRQRLKKLLGGANK